MKEMVKKNESDWTNCAINTNSTASIRKYLEACQNWLITPHDKKETEQNHFCNKMIDCPHIQETYIGMYETDMRNVTTFSCTVCKSTSNYLDDGKSIVANPFTRAQFMLLCDQCHHDITSFR